MTSIREVGWAADGGQEAMKEWAVGFPLMPDLLVGASHRWKGEWRQVVGGDVGDGTGRDWQKMSNSGSADGWNEEKGELVLHLWHTNRREGEQKTLIWENVWDEMFIILISYFPPWGGKWNMKTDEEMGIWGGDCATGPVPCTSHVIWKYLWSRALEF